MKKKEGNSYKPLDLKVHKYNHFKCYVIRYLYHIPSTPSDDSNGWEHAMIIKIANFSYLILKHGNIVTHKEIYKKFNQKFRKNKS